MNILQHPAASSTLAGLALTCWAVACGPGPPAGKHPVHPVEGRVVFRGRPVPGAQVSLLPVDPAKFAPPVPRPTGLTDLDGRFRLMTYYEGDGAPDGDYLVGIVGRARPTSEAGNLLDAARPPAEADVVGPRFVDPRTSGLKATVKPETNALEPFDLKR